jgi:release factor glutamine methyltransferase
VARVSTLGELVTAASDRLAVAGVDSARVDAELLAAELFGMQRRDLVLHLADEIDDVGAADYEGMVRRREQREPLQYILGTAPFRYLLIDVGPGVFIPRPETELLVDAVVPFAEPIEAPTVVDLCSGSGALAFAVADEVPHARLFAVENDEGALAWLRRNALETDVEVVAGDVREPQLLAQLDGTVDVVVSNPPYVPDGTPVSPEVAADPVVAVFAGPDGLAVIPSVIGCAARLLRQGGLFVMEHDDTHGDVVPKLLAADGRWTMVTDRSDLTARPRFVVAVRA